MKIIESEKIQKNNNLLITTSLTNTWLLTENHNKIFLSEACLLYSNKHIWHNLAYELCEYHWNDRKILQSDHDYLEDVYENVLKSAAVQLNEIHGITNSVNYWRIIIGPWLINYISIIFDKYQQLNFATIKHSNLCTVKLNFESNENPFLVNDFNDFISKVQTDKWNYLIFLRIICDAFKNVKLLEKNYEFDDYSSQKITDNLYNKFRKKLLSLLDYLPSKKKYFFHSPYFDPIKYFTLSLRLRQVPSFNNSFFDFKSESKVKYINRNISLNFNYRNKFELLLCSYFFLDIPMIYLEKYNDVSHFSNKIKLNPKVILTANSYWSDDVFKIWLAKMSEKGIKIIILEHGGSFPLPYMTFFHEEKISELFITWFTPHLKLKDKQKQLPANKIRKIHHSKISGNYCTYIGFESPRYGYRLSGQPKNSQVLFHFDESIILYNHLDIVVQDVFRVKPYTDLGWQTRDRYIDQVGINKIFSENLNFSKILVKSKVIICSYPQTTFSEAMASGNPCILYYNPKFNEIVSEANSLIDILVDASIIFHCPVEAAEHINKYWFAIDEWWLSEKVIKARALFCSIALGNQNNFYNEWIDFLKSYD
jgi:putative transferase (TIGR04331 family)